ncbi:hypothetical protein FHW79_006447 [Azospirillum sp. OGB3]|uniref:RNA-directed DNA polymerase n=1 Tax=Azospirillum sp. OGB3 TaxID=2587012 RepID=UPI00160600B0|nr:RNA-directed DNA polymerase [Azospirillum sp. OGB3]MBB3268772.1 hypothetical protein [Azospirillum sp. OGB3]
MPPSRIRHQEIFSALMHSAYLPAEVPPAITARHFAAYCRSNYNSIKSKESTVLSKITTRFDRFNVPRENETRRDLALVHPASQARVSLIITKNHREIRTIIGNSQISLYNPNPDLQNYRAFKGVSFANLDKKRSDIARRSCYVLSADISRFFYTIYTHSIPWAVLGKAKVKELMNGGKKGKKGGKPFHWTDELDRALQSCQSRETFGIPVGPDTSRIIAEVLLSGIHNDEGVAKAISGRPGFRLVDDFFIGFNSEVECAITLTSLRNALSNYNLQLNDDKTALKPSQAIFMDRWRYELMQQQIRQGNARSQANDIRKLTDLALYHTHALGNSFPVKWVVQKLISIQYDDGNFGLILSTLLRLSREFPVCISHVATFIINNKKKCQGPLAINLISEWLNVVFKTHARHSHDFEVAWALVICGALKIKVSRAEFSDYHSSTCSAVYAILGLLNEKGLLKEKFATFNWRAAVKKEGVDGVHWLMYYESVRRRWTKDKQMEAAIQNHPFMSDLLSNGVTFLDDAIFGDVSINLTKRRIRKINAALMPIEEDPTDEGSFGLASM